MMRIRHLFLFILLPAATFAQEKKLIQAEALGKEINSGAEEIGSLLSPDGKSLYFLRAFDAQNIGGKAGAVDIWVSRKDSSGNWTKATNKLKNWNNLENNAVIGISSNSQTIYLLNSYNIKSGIASASSKGSKPVFIPIPGLDGKEFIGLYINPAADVLFISMKGEDSYGQEDLYVSTKSSTGQWTEPTNLGTTINTDGFEIAPFLSPDGNHLYFSSNGHEGLGDADIFVSERLYNSWIVWTKPQNLGAPINSDKFDSYFSIGSDGYSYFSSNRDRSFSDIYKCKTETDHTTAMQDSVNRIINDTQKLLAELKITDTEIVPVESADFISFGKQSKELSSVAVNQITALFQKTNVKTIKSVELIGYSEDVANRVLAYSLSADRVKAVQLHLGSAGINAKIIKTRLVQDASRLTNNPRAGVEIKLMFSPPEKKN